MLVVGTKKEEFEAVWVRNEWVRFCERLSGGEECTLIPLYKNMSPYDLPAEFVNIQGLDMGKIGFIQDLTDAVKRLIHQETPVQMQVQGNAADPASGANLRKRAYLFLEQGDTQSASQYFERALDVNAEDAEAYWGKMLVELGCRKEEELPDQDTPLTANNNYNMALRFADEEQRQRYNYYADTVQTKLYEKQKAEEEARRIAEEQEQERLRQEQEEKERRKKEREEQEEKRRQKNKVVSKRVLKIALILIVLGILYELILFIPVGIAGGVFLSRVCGRYELAERWVDFAWDSTPVEDEIFDYQLYSRIDDMFDYAACTYLYKYKEMERLGGVWEEELSDDVATTIASHGTFIGISEDGDFVYGCFNDGIFSYSLNDINQYRRYAKKRGKIQTLYRGSGYCDFYIVTQKGELDHIYLDNDNGYKLVIEYNYLGWKDIEEVKRWSGSIPDGEGWYSQGYLFGKKSDGSVCCYNTSTGSKKDETVWVDIGNADSGTYQANIVELDLDELEEHWDDIHDLLDIVGEAD
jgi:tetratricopeptide (TPR) repeat protein